MAKKSHQKDSKVDPVGEELYEKVLHKPVFNQEHPQPLVGVREFTVNHLFARVWSRSIDESDESRIINLRERRLITIALLAAQGRNDQLKEHVTGAYCAGIAEEVLLEVMIHVAHYAGWAAGTSGQAIIQEVYKNKIE